MIYLSELSDVVYKKTEKGFNVKSKDSLNIDLIEIYNGNISMNKLNNLLEHIYLDGTPVRSNDKQLNFEKFNIEVEINSGINSQIKIEMHPSSFDKQPTIEFK